MSLTFCSLASGSSGNCQLIASDKTKLLVDAGMSGKYIKSSLQSIDVKIEDINGILLTHEHSDHISGLGVLMRRYKMPLFVTEKTWRMTKDKIGEVDASQVYLYDDMKGIEIGEFWIEGIPISHDAIDPLCYVMTHRLGKIGIATDLGTVTEKVITSFKTCDLLMVESNHDEELLKTGPYPMVLKRRILSEYGHLSNEDAGFISREIIEYGHAKHIILAHLSKENNFPDLAYETVRGILAEKQIIPGKDVQLDLTYRDRVGKIYRLRK